MILGFSLKSPIFGAHGKSVVGTTSIAGVLMETGYDIEIGFI
jgi:hypothetical protein